MSVIITLDDIRAYAEVDYIINHMNIKYKEKVPEKMLAFFSTYKDPNHDRICKLINDCLVNSAKICDIRRELYDDFEPDPEEFIQNEKLALEKQSKAVEEEMKKDKKVKKIENSMKLNWAKILNLILSIREQ